MFAFLDSPAEIGILVLVILLLFGGSQLPKLAKNLGQAQKEFKDGLNVGQKGEDKDIKDVKAAAAAGAAAGAAAASTPTVPVSDAEKAAELRKLEARMAELKGEQPRSTEL
ncbi:MAG: twin-arginine translocase TatA/TatE family subunit [Ilumatobacteraceae bacterium]